MAALVAIMGYFAVSHTLAKAVARNKVTLARSLAPGDGRVTALMAVSLTGPEATAVDRRQADRLSREALQQDATAVVAVSALGLNSQIRGDTAGARRLFAYAQRLSRRDLPTQLWAIEDAVGRGDIPGTLRHYDIALRTAKQAPDLLFPVLTSAIADSAIRTAVIRTLAGKPLWGERFVSYVAGHGPDPQSTAQLLLGLRRAGVEVPEPASAVAINALIAGSYTDQAWAYYRLIRPGVDRRRSRDPHFTASVEAPSALDWTPINDAGVSTSIQRGIFDFSAPASVGGPLLQQLELLPPGNYLLSGHSSGIDQAEEARPYWLLTCQGTGELGRVVLPNSMKANGSFMGRFSVPAGCPAQMLALIARPSDAVSGLSGQIDRVQLIRAR